MVERTLYEVLMLHPSATIEVINAAYRALAKLCHPDHAGPDGSEKMAQAAGAGARRIPGVSVLVKPVDEVSKKDLDRAHGIMLGSPTYFANIPGTMKTVIDDWNWKLKVDFTDKVGGAFATAGGRTGGQGHVVTSLLLFMLNNRMVVAGPLYQNPQTGSIWGESGAVAVTGPVDAGVSDSELDGAQQLGERVARLAVKMNTATQATNFQRTP